MWNALRFNRVVIGFSDPDGSPPGSLAPPDSRLAPLVSLLERDLRSTARGGCRRRIPGPTTMPRWNGSPTG